MTTALLIGLFVTSIVGFAGLKCQEPVLFNKDQQSTSREGGLMAVVIVTVIAELERQWKRNPSR